MIRVRHPARAAATPAPTRRTEPFTKTIMDSHGHLPAMQKPLLVTDFLDRARNYYGDQDAVVATTEYGIRFPSAIERENLVATQFHPEKSGEFGLLMLSNFLRRG